MNTNRNQIPNLVAALEERRQSQADIRRESPSSPTGRIDASHAIATAYRDFVFRSRLEAKWAVFFDLCGWSWSYEPMDLNGWIPDFAIGEHPTLVEVKPFFREDQYAEAKTKIIESGWSEAVILLGADPTWIAAQNEDDPPVVGWLFHQLREGDWHAEPLHFGITEGNGKPGLCPMDGSWFNEIWKRPENDRYANKWSRVSMHDREKELVKRWANACNASQWMKYEQPQQ